MMFITELIVLETTYVKGIYIYIYIHTLYLSFSLNMYICKNVFNIYRNNVIARVLLNK